MSVRYFSNISEWELKKNSIDCLLILLTYGLLKSDVYKDCHQYWDTGCHSYQGSNTSTLQTSLAYSANWQAFCLTTLLALISENTLHLPTPPMPSWGPLKWWASPCNALSWPYYYKSSWHMLPKLLEISNWSANLKLWNLFSPVETKLACNSVFTIVSCQGPSQAKRHY